MTSSWRSDLAAQDSSFRWSHDGGELVADWHGAMRVRATVDGRLLSVEPATGTPADLVRKYREGPVEAFLRSRRGQYSLHASAVASAGKAVLCLGDSGAGKSTVAARMCSQADTHLLADDCAGLDLRDGRWHVLPTESDNWLDSNGPVKSAHRPPRVATTPVRLACVAHLAFSPQGEAVRITEVSGFEAGFTLLRSLMRFDCSSETLSGELPVVSSMLEQVVMVTVTRPRTVAPDKVASELAQLLKRQP